uniref:C-type lectin domain-containing protein n=1 Tax=Timema cristinae TaxID=61476 RepID=A0A7R9DR67_TIMCR|nr:unnamed protein product [Timema cristinae]
MMRLGATPLLVSLAVFLAHCHAHAGYKRFPGVGYYKMHFTPKTWDRAEEICVEEDGHLVVLDSEAEYLIVKNLIKSHHNPNIIMHAGFRDNLQDGDFRSIYGTPVIQPGYNAPWEGGQSLTPGPDEHCGTVGSFESPFGGGYSIGDCETVRPYVCEREANYGRSPTYPMRKAFHKLVNWLF